MTILRDEVLGDPIPADEAQVRRARVRGMVIAEMLPARPLRPLGRFISAEEQRARRGQVAARSEG